MSQVYQELKILKFLDLMYLPNCPFKSLIEKKQRFGNSFVHLRHCSYNHNYLSKSKAKCLIQPLLTEKSIALNP